MRLAYRNEFIIIPGFPQVIDKGVPMKNSRVSFVALLRKTMWKNTKTAK
jgi:hypothetical protein